MLIADFLPRLLPDLPGCPSAAVKQALIDAAKEFLTESQVWNEVQDPTQIVSGVQEYSLDAPDSSARCIDVRAIYAPWMPRGSLIGVTLAQIARDDPAWAERTGSQPVYYTRAFDFSNYRVFPMPTNVPAGTQVRVHGVYTLTDAATKLPDDIVTRYGEAIASGAKQRLMVQPGKTWSNDKLAVFHLGRFESGKLNAKIDAMHGQTTGDIFVPPRRFGQ
jgi:hypothetical protein